MGLFQFEKSEVDSFIEYKLKTFKRFKEPLNFVINTLTKLGHSFVIESLDGIDLNKVRENEGKNYEWSVFTYKNVTLVIRRYRYHLTIFTKVVNNGVEYGAFTFNTEFDKFGDKHDEIMESYYDKPFTGLNEIIVDLLNLLTNREEGVHWVWNSVSLKRPNYVDIKLIFSDKSISSYDNFIFCMEELSNIYLSLFAETTMLQKIKEYTNKIGELINKRYKVGKVNTELKDGYYHAVGITLIDTLCNDKEDFQDVYSLSRWYFEDIFKEMYLYKGDVYITSDEFIIGEPVVYKGGDGINIFEERFNKENFIPLKKFE